MGAIDMWCNPFTHEGIQHLFIDNEEVHFMMGTQWGRTGNMVGYTAAEFVAENMDPLRRRESLRTCAQAGLLP